MIKKLTLTTTLIALPLFAEMSVFGAGDLESPNPYGLTTAEKVIVKNKQILKKNQQRINRVDNSIKELYERVEGLETVVDGDSRRLNKTSKDLKKYLQGMKSFKSELKLQQDKRLQKVDTKLEGITLKLDSIQSDVDTNKENIALLKKAIDDVVKLVNNINSEYVSRKDFNKLLEMLDKQQSVKKVVKKKSSPSDFGAKSKKELIKKARYYFKKDYFTKALPILEYLIKNNYRPAECNFLVGEIKYYRKKYADALHFFKTSMMLYDKAKYLPRLLLHSAICFEKTGNKSQAKTFYSTLIDIYPDTNEAKQASKKITKLN